ncbi:Cdc7p-Dbf4p kinase complex regulatory subunit [Thecaphora frezii]
MPPHPIETVRQPLTTRNIIAKPERGTAADADSLAAKSPPKKVHPVVHRPSLIPRPRSAVIEGPAPTMPTIGRLPSATGTRAARQPEAEFPTLPQAEPLQREITTPKKRAVPVEDVHVRNAPGGSPSKRSRSSKSGTGSSTHEPSTGTTTSLAQDLSSVKVAEGGAVTASASRSGIAGATTGVSSTTAVARPIRPIRPPTVTKPTTTRIDRNSRVTEQERAARDRQAYEDKKIWRHKFRKAFPSFVFYFDSFDEATVKELTGVIQSLGGSVDSFFSRSITHLITTRLVPPAPPKDRHDGGKENSPNKDAAAKDGVRKPLRPTVSKSRLSPTKGSAADRQRNNQPLYSERNPFDDAGPPTPMSNDILLKAQSFGMKVWRHDKLTTILKMLIDEPVAPPMPADKQDLSQMLEREKLYGTHERDPNASRGDHHYFRKGNYYLLVEDATMEHRPIMCSEFEYNRHQQQEGIEPPWPVLYGELEGRCPFTRYEVTEQQRNKMSRSRNSHQTLRRAVSLNNMMRRHTGPPSPRPPNEGFAEVRNQQYPMASGNSVSITSNIASTTSTALTDLVGTVAGLPQNRRVAELNRRMHTPLMHSPTTRLPASPASFVAGSAGSGLGIAADHGSGSGSSMATPGHLNVHNTPTAAASHSRGAVVRRMLGMTEHEAKQPSTLAQSGVRRSVSTSAVAPIRPQEKRPGYCENCRIKYDNFDDHVVSRKHRKFAVDDANFVDIDQLILRVQRPLAPEYHSYLSGGADEDGTDLGLLDAREGHEAVAESHASHWEHGFGTMETEGTYVQAAAEGARDEGESAGRGAYADPHGDGVEGYPEGEGDEDGYGEEDEEEMERQRQQQQQQQQQHEHGGATVSYGENDEWHRQTVGHYSAAYVAVPTYTQGALPQTPLPSLSRRAGTPYGEANANEIGSPYV